MKKLAPFLFLFMAGLAFADREPLVMAYSEDAPPVSWTDNGIARGIFIDVVDEVVTRRLGIPVSHTVAPWARAQQLVKNGLADGLVTVASEARKSFMNVGLVPVQTHSNRIIVRANHPRLNDIEAVDHVKSLAPFHIGVQLGNGWAKENLVDMQVTEVASIELLLKMAAAERIDLVLQGDAVALFYRKQLGYTDKLVVLPHVFESFDFNFMVRKNSQYADLPAQFDSELQKMIDDGSIQKIFDRYR